MYFFKVIFFKDQIFFKKKMIKFGKNIFRKFSRTTKNISKLKRSGINYPKQRQPGPKEVIKIEEKKFKKKFPIEKLNSLYLPFEHKEIKKLPNGKIQITKKQYKFDIKKILKTELSGNLIKAIGFLRFRNFGLTEYELDILLEIFSEGKNFEKNSDFIQQNSPEIFKILSDASDQITFSTPENAIESFSKISKFYSHTTDTKVVENYLKNINKKFDQLFKEDSYLPARLNIGLEFIYNLLKTAQAIQIIDDKENKIKFIDGYEYQEFFLNFYKKMKFLNLEQALKLLDFYYEFIIKTAKERAEGKMSTVEDYEPDFEELFEDRVTNLQILENLDFVFVEYFEKMDLFEAIHILYIFSKCNYKNSLFLRSFAKGYLRFIKEGKRYNDNKKVLMKLLFALSNFSGYPNERMLWRVVELQMLRSQFFDHAKYQEIVLAMAFFSKKKFGSPEFWSKILKKFFDIYEEIEIKFGGRNEKWIDSQNNVVILALYEMIRNEIEEDFDLDTHLSKNMPIVVKWIENVSQQPDVTQISKISLGMAAIITTRYMINFRHKLNGKIMSKLIKAAKRLTKNNSLRKFLEKSDHASIVIYMLLEIFEEDTKKRILLRKSQLERAKRGESIKNNIMLQSGENYEFGWGDLNRIFYNVVKNRREKDVYFLMLIWLRMGVLQMNLSEKVEKYFGERDMNLDILMIKRRVLSNYFLTDVLQIDDKSKILGFLEFLFICNFVGFSQEFELGFQLRFSKCLDHFSFRDVLKICLIMKEFVYTTEEFFDLSELVLTMKAEEMEFEFEFDVTENFEKIQEELEGYICFDDILEGYEERMTKFKAYGIEKEDHWEIVSVEERSDRELKIIGNQADFWDFLEFEEDKEFKLGLSQILEIIQMRKNDDVIKNKLDINWMMIKRGCKDKF